jgi:thiol-disulfide isomerase/thioredoxin
MVQIAVLCIAALFYVVDAPRLLFFTADHCPACDQAKPVVTRMADAGYPIEEVDVSANPQWADHFGVDRIPCFVMVQDGKAMDKRFGAMNAQEISSMFQDLGYRPDASNRIANTGDSTNSSGSARFQSPDPHEQSTQADNDGEPRPNTGTRSRQRVQVASTFTDSGTAENSTVKASGSKGSGTSGRSKDARGSLGLLKTRALQATVRIQVEDDEGINHGTGTIIHTSGNDALVATCGHIFRDSKGRGKITAEIGFPERIRNVDGELLKFDSEQADVALIGIRLPVAIEPIPLASESFQPVEDEIFFSVGCSHGDDPTYLEHSYLRLAKYNGALKYDVTERPVDGRSGGGLFNARGELVGICNAAAVDDPEGIFSAINNVYFTLGECNLKHLFENPVRRRNTDMMESNLVQQDSPAGNGLLDSRVVGSNSSQATDVEMIVVIRSKANPEQTQSIVLQNPSSDLLEQIAGARQSTNGLENVLVGSKTESKAQSSGSNLQPPPRPIRVSQRDDNGNEIRAQSPR